MYEVPRLLFLFGFGTGMMLSNFLMRGGMMLELRASVYICLRRAQEVLGIVCV